MNKLIQSKIIESVDRVIKRKDFCHEVVTFIKSRGIENAVFMRDFIIDTDCAGTVKLSGVIEGYRNPSIDIISLDNDTYVITADIKNCFRIRDTDPIKGLYQSDLGYYKSVVISKRYPELYNAIMSDMGRWPKNEKELGNSNIGKKLSKEIKDRLSSCDVYTVLSKKFKNFLPYHSMGQKMPICFIKFDENNNRDVYFIYTTAFLMFLNTKKVSGSILDYLDVDMMFEHISNNEVLSLKSVNKCTYLVCFDLLVSGDGVEVK